MPIHQQFRGVQLSRQIMLAPETLSRAGKDCLRVRTVATQVLRELHDTIEVSSGSLAIILALAFQLAQRFPRQILSHNGFFLVGLISGHGRLKVEAESAACRIFKICEFMDLFASNHSLSRSLTFWNLI